MAFKPLDEVRLRRLHPAPGEVTADEAVSGLRLADDAPADRPYVIVNMVATADGKAALEGRTTMLGGAADRALFHHLRTQVDAVMVGARTAVVERYPRLVRDAALREKRMREGLEPDPLAVIVSRAAGDDLDIPLLRDADQPSVVLGAPQSEAPAPFDPRPLLRDLRERGIRSLLCEGGPMLNSSLVSYGLVDELFLCVTPLLAGGQDALTIVAGAPLPEPAELDLLWLLEHDGELFARYALQKRLQNEGNIRPAQPRPAIH